MHSRIKIKGRTYITPGWHGCWSAHSRVIRWVLRLTSVLPSMDSSSVFFYWLLLWVEPSLLTWNDRLINSRVFAFQSRSFFWGPQSIAFFVARQTFFSRWMGLHSSAAYEKKQLVTWCQTFVSQWMGLHSSAAYEQETIGYVLHVWQPRYYHNYKSPLFSSSGVRSLQSPFRKQSP